jgi:hypothetical protein
VQRLYLFPDRAPARPLPTHVFAWFKNARGSWKNTRLTLDQDPDTDPSPGYTFDSTSVARKLAHVCPHPPAPTIDSRVTALEEQVRTLSALNADLEDRLRAHQCPPGVPPEHIFVPASNYMSPPAGTVRIYTDGRHWQYSYRDRSGAEVWSTATPLTHG